MQGKLADLTHEAAAIAGPGHWVTGCRDGAHATVRALERYRDDIPAGDSAVERYLRAVGATAAQCAPITLQVTGLTLASGSVMASLVPTDGHADRLRAEVLPRELGPDAWLEADYGPRDIWHLTLVHFTGDLADPERLIEWVNERRRLDLGVATIDDVELVRFRYDEAAVGGPFMRPESLGIATLAG